MPSVASLKAHWLAVVTSSKMPSVYVPRSPPPVAPPDSSRGRTAGIGLLRSAFTRIVAAAGDDDRQDGEERHQSHRRRPRQLCHVYIPTLIDLPLYLEFTATNSAHLVTRR